tara:strand:+ start:107 stop:814 length:708 start_codon:yes stop_codon:yes gene_type:complete
MEKGNTTNIYTKLLSIQRKVKGLSKDKKSHNYDYVTGNKLLSFIKPLMDEQGLILKQEIISIDNTRQDYNIWDKWKANLDGTKGDWKPKNEILSKVMMKFTWVDCETGEKDENLFGANGQNDWEKGLGSALTYGERYFLLKYFHIPTDADDIDNPERKPADITQPAKQQNSKTAKPQLILFNEGTKDLTTDMSVVFDYMKKGTFKTLADIAETYTISKSAEDSIQTGFTKLKKAK